MILEFMDKAFANLDAARLCFENGLYDASANRAYYAAFQAAVAALAFQGIKKHVLGHEWVQAEFNGRMIKRAKRIPGRFKSYLPDMQAVRDIADYDPEAVSKRTASNQVRKAEEMVRLIEKVLGK